MSSAQDPFYIVKEEIQESIDKVLSSFHQWERIPAGSQEQQNLTKELLVGCESIEWQVDELDKAIAVAARDPSWYGIDQAELDKRRRWTSTARTQVGNVKKTVVAGKNWDGTSTSNVNGMRRELMRMPNSHQGERSNQYAAANNDDFVSSESDRQLLLIKQQDEELDELSASVERIGGVGLTIHEELLAQEKIIDELGTEMESTSNRLDFVQKKVGMVMKKAWCLSNCSCVAYSFVAEIGCMVWAGGEGLVDIQQFSSAGEDLFLRLAASELGKGKKKQKLIISLTTVSGVILLGVVIYGLHRLRAKQKGKREKKTKDSGMSYRLNTSTDTLVNRGKPNDTTLELPTFDFEEIAAATDNFSISSKIGEGGFGPVFKGKLQDGQEIAVKRLSRCSQQGIEEFKNEIILISRLQHRNLVRLLGCCIEGEEMVIVYEYMPNKSLDTFLFDSNRRAELDWAKRFNIIQGIARGLLYLHRDSCLKIIHRDLKASNILLDEDMNPKISDFGLARTFLYTQELANTHRVVGTLGYISPEYAMGGVFSEKSDVFSFGVLILEIVSGKKNNNFHYNEERTSLLGHGWDLWNEGRAMDFIDQVMAESCTSQEVTRCLHIGLLCVQDHAADRPTMSTVVLMLSSEIDCPQPKRPTFTFQSLLGSSDLRSQSDNVNSVNTITVSMVEGR